MTGEIMRSWKLWMSYSGLAIALGMFPMLLGCNTMEGALVGAGLGAGTGALTGSMSGRAGTGTAIGAGAGALIGGIMGYQFEQMEKQRQAQAYTPPPGYPVGGTGPYPVNQPYSQPYNPPTQQPQQYGAHPQAYYPPTQGTTTVQGGAPTDASQSYEVPQTATPITTIVNCPKCSQTLDVSDFRKGTKVRCPACNNVFVY